MSKKKNRKNKIKIKYKSTSKKKMNMIRKITESKIYNSCKSSMYKNTKYSIMCMNDCNSNVSIDKYIDTCNKSIDYKGK